MSNVSDPHSLSLMSTQKLFPPAKAVFAAFAILLAVRLFFSFTCIYPGDTSMNQATKDVSASYNALIDLLESIENFLGRLDIYTTIPLTAAMTDIVIKLFVEVLSTLALATKQARQGRISGPCFR